MVDIRTQQNPKANDWRREKETKESDMSKLVILHWAQSEPYSHK